MAPFRSSRSNRHLQHENVPRNRGGAGGPIDHDPTEGLPVKKWQLADVTIKQVEKDDDGDEMKTGSVNPDYPWPELPLPKDFHQLPPHSQEILRRARMGNTRVRPAVYNPVTGTYTAAPPLNPTTVKSKLLTTGPNPVATSTITPPPADIDMLDEDPEADVTAQPKPTLDEDRTFTVRKWMLVPAAEADKRPEPKYLADRRPGLKNIYGFGQAQNIAAGSGDSTTTGTVLGAVVNAAGQEISSTGLELGSAGGIGMGTSASMPVVETPRRRGPPPPPKRKKKGGLGRRKKVSVDRTPGEQQGQGATGTDGAAGGAGASSGMVGVKVEDADAGAKDAEDEDVSGSDDGDEGSEEGEIDEGEIMDVEPTKTSTAHEHKVDAVGPDPSTAVGKSQVDASKVDAAEAVALPAAKVSQVEGAMPLVAFEMKDVAEEEIPPPASKMTDLVEEKGSIFEESVVQHVTAPAPLVQQPQVDESDVDLLGSLDRAVEGMHGANVDAMDIAEEKLAE